MDVFAEIWQWLCDTLSDALQWVLDLLPDSPFKLLDMSPISPYLKWLNWFIPVGLILDIIGLWLIAIAGYYIWSVLLRWIKAIN